MFKVWLNAFRLRTLPLALACIGMGVFLAIYQGTHKPIITFLALTTATLLQILSNLANDYGDWQNGADSLHRIGPKRTMQAGLISAGKMQFAIVIVTVLCLISGIMLLYLALNANFLFFISFLFLGVGAIIAALKYTAGKNPYGYRALGDLAVFVFFGPVAVLGTYFLHNQNFEWHTVLPALSMGLFATAVLNINNMRDIESDKLAGKITIPVILGLKNAKFYHTFLITLAVVSAFFHVFFVAPLPYPPFFLLAVVFLGWMQFLIFRASELALDPFLKRTALFTLVFTIFWGLSLMYGTY